MIIKKYLKPLLKTIQAIRYLFSSYSVPNHIEKQTENPLKHVKEPEKQSFLNILHEGRGVKDDGAPGGLPT